MIILFTKYLDKYGLNSEIFSGYFWRFLQLFGKQGTIFYIFIICAKLLSPREFGEYNYLLAIIFFLSMFADFGISGATAKYVAEYNVVNKVKLKAVIFNSIFLIISFAIVVFLIAIFWIGEKTETLLLLPFLLLVPISSLYDGVYCGLKRFKQLAIISLFIGVLVILFSGFFITTYGIFGALGLQGIYYFLTILVLLAGYHEIKFSFNKEVLKEVTQYALVIGMANLGYFAFARVNIFILNYFGLITEIGYYEILNKIFIISLIPFSIFSQVLAPRITELYAKNKLMELFIKYKKYLKLSFSGGLLVLFSGLIILPFIIKNFLSTYNSVLIINSFYILSLLFVSQAMSNLASVGFSTPSGNASLNLYFLVIFGSLNILLSVLLVHSLGFIGIIYSTLLIKFCSDILFVVFLYFKFKKQAIKI